MGVAATISIGGGDGGGGGGTGGIHLRQVLGLKRSMQIIDHKNCEPEVNVCCTYQPPPTTSTTVATTTTQKRFITCTANTACVYDQDCRNGEILSNVVVNLEPSKAVDRVTFIDVTHELCEKFTTRSLKAETGTAHQPQTGIQAG
uniref:Uncharacterized protein n=1 Tax=Glossina austeni TaxID=7395 RepID=A0A1A9US90_GLOAU